MISTAAEASAHYERLRRLVSTDGLKRVCLIGILQIAAESCDDKTLGQIARTLLADHERATS